MRQRAGGKVRDSMARQNQIVSRRRGHRAVQSYLIGRCGLIVTRGIKILVQLVVIPIKNAEITLDVIGKSMLQHRLEQVRL